MLQLYSI